MLAIVDGRPKILNLREILDVYLAHQKEVVTRRTIYDKKKAEARAHILEGYRIALDNIDDNKIIQKIEKLYDHITLYISKLNYINSNVLKKNSGDLISREQIRELKYKMRVTEDKIYDNNLKSYDDKLNRLEYIKKKKKYMTLEAYKEWLKKQAKEYKFNRKI